MVTGSGIAASGLGGPQGYGETALPRSDDESFRQDWRAIFGAGLNAFGTFWAADQIYVNTNGTISFGAAFADYPTATPAPLPPTIAPFWADVDTRLRGEGVESGPIYVDLDSNAGVVSVTWFDVGAYRRDTSVVNRFQVQLFDRGVGDFDIALRYEVMSWTIGSSAPDTGARAFLSPGGAGAAVHLMPGAPHQALADLDVNPGNSGVTGLWVYAMRGGQLGGTAPSGGVILHGTGGADVLEGGPLGDVLYGHDGADILRGFGGNDTLYGGDGPDTLNGGDGDDVIFGGATEADLRDLIYGGNGHDTIDAGHGNDLVYGGEGNDTILGGFGADELHGQEGNDNISGGPGSDVIFGGPGSDFINGGFGNDRLNGGPGADVFFHLGAEGHGTDWIQDFSSAEGDRLQFGAAATRDQFQVNFAVTAGAGLPGVAEAFVIHRPSGQILWALVDGGALDRIDLQAGSAVFDLLG